MKAHGWRSALVVSSISTSRAVAWPSQAGIAPVYSAHARVFSLHDLYSIPREVGGLRGLLDRELHPVGAANPAGLEANPACDICRMGKSRRASGAMYFSKYPMTTATC
jgi:hypothetical protein